MTSRISKTTKFFLAGAACALFCTTTASATEFLTVWKTTNCPGADLVWPGVMEAPVFGMAVAEYTTQPSPEGIVECSDPLANCPIIPMGAKANAMGLGVGVGGPFCVLNLSPRSASAPIEKVHRVVNALITATADDLGEGTEGDVWNCAVCVYKQPPPGNGIPALSLLGTAVLMGGLLTAGAYAFGKRRAEPAK